MIKDKKSHSKSFYNFFSLPDFTDKDIIKELRFGKTQSIDSYIRKYYERLMSKYVYLYAISISLPALIILLTVSYIESISYNMLWTVSILAIAFGSFLALYSLDKSKKIHNEYLKKMLEEESNNEQLHDD